MPHLVTVSCSFDSNQLFVFAQTDSLKRFKATSELASWLRMKGLNSLPKRTSGRLATEPRRISWGFQMRVSKKKTKKNARLQTRKRCYFKVLKLTQNKNKDKNKARLQAQIRLIIQFQMKKSPPSVPRQACSILEGFSLFFFFSRPHVRLDKRPAEYIILFRGLGGLALAPVRIHLVR